MAPHAFEGGRPFPQRANRHCIDTVEHLSSLPPRFNQTDLAQHLQMLGDGGLLHFHGVDDLADRALLQSEVIEDVAAARFGDGVESVGGCSRSSHDANIFPYQNMSSIIFYFPIPLAGDLFQGASSLYFFAILRGGQFMTTRLSARASVLFVLLLALCGAASANNSWVGTLLDASGKPVAGAAVHLHSNANGHDYESRTNGAGEFHFESLEAGAYQLSVTVNGEAWTLAAPYAVSDGSPLNASVVLSAENQTLALRSNPESRGSGGEHLSSGEVSSLPLNTRDFSKLLLLAAGTMTDTNGAANFTQQFATNGQRGTASVFHIDGGDTSDPELGGATFSNFNVDAIQEVQSSSGVMPAEIGHGAAGFTNVVTKSGTNQIHGSAFEFVRNAAFDARNFFDHPNAVDPRRIPPFARNEFGVTIGGPVALPHVYEGRDKTFFFGEYQGFRQVLGTTQVIPVPTVAERQGIDVLTFTDGAGNQT